MPRIHWLDILIAPLTWLERTRGRRRLALLAVYGLVLVGGGVLVGREAVLWRLPDAPEPFDLARSGHVDLPDADNARRIYQRAGELLVRDNQLFLDLPRTVANRWDWTRTDPRVRAWAELNRAALGVWLQGTELPDLLLIQPERFRGATEQTTNDLLLFANLGLLEATRRQAAGDLAGAWTYYRAVIRSGMHVAHHAGIQGSIVGSGIIREVTPKALGWADQTELAADLIRQAAADLTRCRPLMTSVADVIRVEYYATRATLAEPSSWEDLGRTQLDSKLWFTHVPGVRSLWGCYQNEPKRSLKILRLVTAGQLAQCDRPYGDRPRLASPDYLIYQTDGATPAMLWRIKPDDLLAWVNASRYRGIGRNNNYFVPFLEWKRGSFDQLQVRLASRAYSLAHNGQMPATYGDLFPAYLDELPAGLGAADRVVAP